MDDGIILRLFTGLLDGADAQVRRIWMGQPPEDAVSVRLNSCKLTPSKTQRGDNEADVAGFEAQLLIQGPANQGEASIFWVGTAVAYVRAALEYRIARDADTTHELVLGRCERDMDLGGVEAAGGATRGVVSASLTVTGEAKRVSGTSIEDHVA